MEPPDRSRVAQPQVQDLYAKLHLEEKIRDGAENLLHEFEAEPHHKLMPRPQNYKKQVLAQLRAASSNIDLLREQIKGLGDQPSTGHVSAPPESRSSMDSDLDSPVAERTPILGVASTSPQRTDSASLATISPALSAVTGLEPPPNIESAGARFAALFDSLDPSDDSHVTISRVHSLAALLASHPALRTEFAMGQICDKVRQFLLSGDGAILAIGYRLIRLVVTTSASVSSLRHTLCLDTLVIRSLSRGEGNSTDTERAQALLLVRSYLAVPGGVDEVTVGVVRAIVAVAEHTDDRFQLVSTETLAEIAVMNADKANKGGALPVLLKAMTDGPRNLAVPIAMVMVNMLDHSRTRKHLRDGRDIAGITAIFTEPLISNVTASQSPSTERLRTTTAVIVTFLRSWAGLECIDTKTLIDCLVIPKRHLQETLLDIFTAALGYPDHDHASPFANHFTARLLQRFMNEGLVGRLIDIQSSDLHLAVLTKVQTLLGHICQITAQSVPEELLQRSIDLPTAFSDKLRTQDNYDLRKLASPIFQVNSAIRGPSASKIHQVQYHDQLLHLKNLPNAPSLGQSPSVWVKMGSQMDETTFKQLINSTHVLTTKTFTRWNWDILLELIQGPLHNPKRLDDAIRTTKFMKRLVSFYRPFKYRFSSIKKSKQNQKYVHVGKELILTLLDTPEGIRYLAGNKLLRQIAECLAQLDPTSGITSSEPLFSPQRLKSTLSFGYFEILGAMSRFPQGQQMLSQLRIWNMFYNIGDTDREDVMRLFISSMDYSDNGHPRLILAKQLTSGPNSTRLFATEFLQALTISKPHSGTDVVQRPTQYLWAIDLLVAQLFDPDMSICKAAVQSLLVFCRDEVNLNHFISLKPSITHLGSIADPLYMLFLSRSSGFEYLTQLDFILQEMDHWVHGYNEKHVAEIEAYLQMENNHVSETKSTTGGNKLMSVWIDYDSMSDGLPFLAPMPRHFFGDLVLTEQGARLLRQKGYVESFVKFITENLNPADDQTIVKLKGSLWAIGHIASQAMGANLISMDVVEAICAIYDRCDVYSLRATAFYAIGLISSSFEGAELLHQCGWGSVIDMFNNELGIALVVNESLLKEAVDRQLEKSQKLPEVEITSDASEDSRSSKLESSRASLSRRDSAMSLASVALSISAGPSTSAFDGDFDFSEVPIGRSHRLASNESLLGRRASTDEMEFPRRYDPTSQSVLTAISDLSNHILANEASKRLVVLRSSKASLFQSSELFKDTMDLLAKYHYKPLVRRFVFELFDTTSILERQLRRRAHKSFSRQA